MLVLNSIHLFYLQTKSQLIFQTYIGQVLISVNPYKELPIYSEEDVKAYRQKYFYEVPPHV